MKESTIKWCRAGHFCVTWETHSTSEVLQPFIEGYVSEQWASVWPGNFSSLFCLHLHMDNLVITCSSFTWHVIVPNQQLYFAHTQRWFAAKKKVTMQKQENYVNGVWLYPKPSNTAGVGAPSDVFAWQTPTWNGWWISIFGQMAGFPNLILKYTLKFFRNCNILLYRELFAWKKTFFLFCCFNQHNW